MSMGSWNRWLPQFLFLTWFPSKVKDVRVPEQLMRAMAAEAEAARNARAKVILMVTLMSMGQGTGPR